MRGQHVGVSFHTIQISGMEFRLSGVVTPLGLETSFFSKHLYSLGILPSSCLTLRQAKRRHGMAKVDYSGKKLQMAL